MLIFTTLFNFLWSDYFRDNLRCRDDESVRRSSVLVATTVTAIVSVADVVVSLWFELSVSEGTRDR